MFITSYPWIVRRAVRKLKNPSPGLTRRFRNRWSCSTMLFRYLGRRSQMRPTFFLQLQRISLNPAIDGRMIDTEATLSHHLFQIAVAEGVAKIPAHTYENDLRVVMSPFEGSGFRHGSPQSQKIRARVSYSRTIGLFLAVYAQTVRERDGLPLAVAGPAGVR